MKISFLSLCVALTFVLSACVYNSFGSVSRGNDNVIKDHEGQQIDQKANEILMEQYNKSKAYFEAAYQQYPDVPRGMLEAISYHYTHFRHITTSDPESCTGMPKAYGVMGMTLDGKKFFRNNLITVAGLSGYSIDDIINDPLTNVKAFAAAFSALKVQLNITGNNPGDMVKILISLSELNISQESSVNDFAMNLYIFGLMTFLNNPEYQRDFNFPLYQIDMEYLFGDNLKIYDSPRILISEGRVTTKKGQLYMPTGIKTACPDYNFANCSWVASPNHYSGWYGTPSTIAMHTVQGSYTGCISWFQNTSASASTHYVVASNSSYAGQITQMVHEYDEAWHVGSENSYAYGYEHEGYVSDPSWYTTTMYQTSAALTRDICTDHSINPLRTGFWPWLAATNYSTAGIPGTCTKIKGHQHYPNQTHTDPGINWNWNYYYKLINNNPTINTLTTATGSFFDSGGASANYADDERSVWVISPAGASYVTIDFTSFSLENTWDYMYIYDGNSVWSTQIGYYTGTTSPGTITSSGGSITIEFRSDCATTAVGWAATWTSSGTSNIPTNLTATALGCPENNVQFTWTNSGTGWYILLSESSSYTDPYIKWISGLTTYTGPSGFVLQSDGVTPLVLNESTTYYWKIWNTTDFTDGPSFTTLNCDNVIPTTSISTPNNWKTADFTATFTDDDNVTVEKAFYQVLDYNGTYWGANSARGFFADNFDVLQPVWTDSAGTWAVTGGELAQTDESVNNSNIFAPLDQTLSNRYLYHFIAKVEGTGTNRRFGFHLFCDDGAQTNRGNSYFVWFRVEGQTLEFFKCINNSFTAASKIITGVTTTPGQYYDFKITYDRILGAISVWRDNVYMGSWTDTSPFSANGNYISFRSGNSILTVNELKVYRSRTTTPLITVGDNSKDIRYQNPNSSTYGAKIKSIVVDGNYNLSDIAYHDLNIDWTPPSVPGSVADGPVSDIDTSWSLNTIQANWGNSSFDQHSDFVAYWYAIGTTVGGTDVVNWTVNAGANYINRTGLSLTDQQVYYVSVKAENGAGLFSNPVSSNGQVAAIPVTTPITQNEEQVSVYPNPNNGQVNITPGKFAQGQFTITLISSDGKTIVLKNAGSDPAKQIYTFDLNTLSVSSGNYIIRLANEKKSYDVQISYVK